MLGCGYPLYDIKVDEQMLDTYAIMWSEATTGRGYNSLNRLGERDFRPFSLPYLLHLLGESDLDRMGGQCKSLRKSMVKIFCHL